MKGRARIPIEEIKKRLPPEVILDESTYNGTHAKARFIDKDYGEFWAVPKDVFSGHKCRARGNVNLSKAKTKCFEDIAHKIPYYIKIKIETYKGRNKKCIWIDEIYGEFEASPKEILIGKKHRARGLIECRNVKYNISDIRALLPEHITLPDEDFINTTTKCRFVDSEFGEFFAVPTSVINGKSNHRKRATEKRKATMMRIYGVEFGSRSPEIMSKIKKSSKKTVSTEHWKTKENIDCTGGYEIKVVNYLNKNKIDFDWQIPFVLDCGTYYCDLYLKADDKYIEIKGWWRQEISRLKWEEFHQKYPNSELWGYKKLKEMKILKK